MRNTQIQQVSNRRRRRRGGLGCVLTAIGLMICAGLTLLLLIPALPAIGLQVAGFQPVGRTDDILSSENAVQQVFGGGAGAINNAAGGGTTNSGTTNSGTTSGGALTVPQTSGQSVSPAVSFSQVAQNGVQPPSIFANAGPHGTYTFTPDEASMSLSTGANGQPVLAINVTEAQALNMCARRSSVCAGGNEYARNLTVDFRPGGAIIYADVKVPSTGVWQRGGGVARFNNATKQFEVLGVDMDGTLYRAPEEVFGLSFDELVTEVNRALQQVTLTANGSTFRLSSVNMGDGELTLILR